MTINKYIAASLLSHVLIVAFLGLTSFNNDRISSVFDVDIVGPFEDERAAPVKPVPAAPVAPRIPAVRDVPEKLPDAKAKPETLYAEGSSSEGNKKELSPPLEKRDERAFSEKNETPLTAPPSALFDKKTIEKFAMKEQPPDKGFTFDTSEFKNRGYMRMLKEKIESIWQYPKEAARLGISGDLYIKFTIKKDGKLGGYELLRTSGYKDLDDAAIKALKDAGPFWPLPADWKEESLEIKGYFIYIYGRSYVM